MSSIEDCLETTSDMMGNKRKAKTRINRNAALKYINNVDPNEISEEWDYNEIGINAPARTEVKRSKVTFVSETVPIKDLIKSNKKEKRKVESKSKTEDTAGYCDTKGSCYKDYMAEVEEMKLDEDNLDSLHEDIPECEYVLTDQVETACGNNAGEHENLLESDGSNNYEQDMLVIPEEEVPPLVVIKKEIVDEILGEGIANEMELRVNCENVAGEQADDECMQNLQLLATVAEKEAEKTFSNANSEGSEIPVESERDNAAEKVDTSPNRVPLTVEKEMTSERIETNNGKFKEIEKENDSKENSTRKEDKSVTGANHRTRGKPAGENAKVTGSNAKNNRNGAGARKRVKDPVVHARIETEKLNELEKTIRDGDKHHELTSKDAIKQGQGAKIMRSETALVLKANCSKDYTNARMRRMEILMGRKNRISPHQRGPYSILPEILYNLGISQNESSMVIQPRDHYNMTPAEYLELMSKGEMSTILRGIALGFMAIMGEHPNILSGIQTLNIGLGSGAVGNIHDGQTFSVMSAMGMDFKRDARHEELQAAYLVASLFNVGLIGITHSERMYKGYC